MTQVPETGPTHLGREPTMPAMPVVVLPTLCRTGLAKVTEQGSTKLFRHPAVFTSAHLRLLTGKWGEKDGFTDEYDEARPWPVNRKPQHYVTDCESRYGHRRKRTWHH